MPPAPEVGVYVHFPWCRRRCPYCDFAIAVARGRGIPHDAYADSVLRELGARAGLFAGRALRSVYFGGGTPALWRPDALGRVLDEVLAVLGDGSELEVTVESNPGDCDAATLAALRAAGANRLSIGVQSFDDGELVTLGRDHTAGQALAAVAAARAAGFGDVSLDLMYGLPGRDAADFARSLDAALAAAPEHLSVYQLTIEPRTTFGQARRTGRLVPVADEVAAELFELAHERLTAAGYEHYEVSSYARPGRRAGHNQRYWRGVEYLGLGSGAHSFWRPAPSRGLRWSAPRSVVRYLAATPQPGEPGPGDGTVAEILEQDEAALRGDLVWLGLRTADGVPRDLVDGAALGRLADAGLLVVDADRVRPTPRGLLFADEIGASLLQ